MKWILFKIIFCGMVVAVPMAIMPMADAAPAALDNAEAARNNQQLAQPAPDAPQDAQPVLQEEQEMRDCSVCFDEKPVGEFPELACGHNGVCAVCLRDQLNPVLDAPNLQEEMRAALRCSNLAHRAVPADNAQAAPRLMQPEDIRLIYADPERPGFAQARADRFNEVVRMLNLRQANVQNEAAFNLYLQENPDARRCPTEGCQWAYLLEAGQRPQNVQCEACNHHFCSHCRAAHPEGERCRRPEEIAQENNNNLEQLTPEERANREWARENLKACPACRHNIQRVAGCNYIRCQCGHEFCWMCLVPDPGHNHQRCLPEDLERAAQLYGRGAGVPSNDNDIFGLGYRPEAEPDLGAPVFGRLPVDDMMDRVRREREERARGHNNNFLDQLRRAREQREEAERRQRVEFERVEELMQRLREQQYYNYGYQEAAAYPADNNFQIPDVAVAPEPADRRNRPFARGGNNPHPMPPFVKGLLILAVAGTGYGVYKLYKYFTTPKIVPIKDIKISLENLLKEAVRDKRLAENGTYVPDAFKKYFAQEVKNNAYGKLNAAQLTALKKIVDDLELAFVAGYCEREYLALINFKIAIEANENAPVSNPDVVQVPVVTKEPQVKRVVSKKRTNRRGRSVKRVK